MGNRARITFLPTKPSYSPPAVEQPSGERGQPELSETEGEDFSERLA